MKRTKKILLVVLTLVALVVTLTITSFASVVDKGAYSFDSITGEVTPYTQTIIMERYPLPTEDGYTYHNQNFTTLGKENNFQFNITLKPTQPDGTEISFSFPVPDKTKNYSMEFAGGDFQVWLLPLFRNSDGSWYYQLQTINKSLSGNFANFYDDFEVEIKYLPTPEASVSIHRYSTQTLKTAYENLGKWYDVLEEELNATKVELDQAQGALEQGNWLFGLFDGLFSGIGSFLETIGSFEIGGIPLSAFLAVVTIAVFAFFVIRLVL